MERQLYVRNLSAPKAYPFVLSPEIAALSMSGSSFVAVATNALMVKRTKPAGNKSAKPKRALPAAAPAASAVLM
jgi:Cu2+-exporting ATPase